MGFSGAGPGSGLPSIFRIVFIRFCIASYENVGSTEGVCAHFSVSSRQLMFFKIL